MDRFIFKVNVNIKFNNSFNETKFNRLKSKKIFQFLIDEYISKRFLCRSPPYERNLFRGPDHYKCHLKRYTQLLMFQLNKSRDQAKEQALQLVKLQGPDQL